MDAWMQTKKRQVAQQKRRPPGPAWSRRIAVDSRGELEPATDQTHIDLVLEVTDVLGEPAAWFDDFWWVDALTLYKDKLVTIHIAPTPKALFNPAVLHQMEMLRRVEKHWKAIGYAYANDFPAQAVTVLVQAPYHEIRIIEAPRPLVEGLTGDEEALPLDDVMARYDAYCVDSERSPILTRLGVQDPLITPITG